MLLSSLGAASPRCAFTPVHWSLSRGIAALHGDCDDSRRLTYCALPLLGPPALRHRRSRLGRPLARADVPKPQLSGSLIVSDCAALVVYGLLASALKAFAQRAAGER